MDTTWIEIGSVTIRAPVTAGTNLLLGVQCGLYGRALRLADDGPTQAWGAFFFAMSTATLAGVVKHGARHLLVPDVLTAVLAVCNMAGGSAVYFAQRAEEERRSRRAGDLRRHLPAAQLAVFTAANVLLGPEILIVIVHTAVGLIPVIGAEGARARTAPGAGRIAVGLSASLLSGLPYVLGLSLGPWFNHIDLTHVLMGVGFALLWSGLDRRRTDPWT